MNHVFRKAQTLPTTAVGWLANLVSRLERTLGEGPGTRATHADERRGVFPGGPRILVVDDTPSNLRDASELLGSLGVIPKLAADGAEAVDLARECSFDLILMDLQMPGLDGLAATMQIRTLEREQSRARTPVLAYTSVGLNMQLVRDCGIDGMLEKPCTAQQLQGCLRHWCNSGVLDDRLDDVVADISRGR